MNEKDDREKTAGVMKELMENTGKPLNTLFRSLHKNGHVFDVVLSVCIKCHHVPNVKLIPIASQILKSCLECRTSSTVEWMMYDMDIGESG